MTNIELIELFKKTYKSSKYLNCSMTCLFKDKIAILYPENNIIKIIKFYNLDEPNKNIYCEIIKEVKLNKFKRVNPFS